MSQQINGSVISKRELHFTQRSASFTSTDLFHDIHHGAAYMVHKPRKC